MEKNRFTALIIKQLKGLTSPQQDRRLEAWLAESEENRAHKEQLTQDWSNSIMAQRDLEVDVAGDFIKFQERIQAERDKTPASTVISISKNRRSWLWAAAAVLLLATFWWTFQKDAVTGDRTLTSSLSEKRTITLTDGTKIWLNEESQLTYPEQFSGGLRTVQLTGEAYFEVAKDAQRPFIVQMKDADVRVLGTAFNLSTRNERTTVTLDEGKVQFSRKNTQALILTAGETAVLDLKSNLFQKIPQYNRNDSSWKSEMLVFQQVKLEVVLQDIENYFGNKVTLENLTLKECIFGGNFPKPDVNSVLSAVASAFEMQLSQDRNGNYSLKGGTCK